MLVFVLDWKRQFIAVVDIARVCGLKRDSFQVKEATFETDHANLDFLLHFLVQIHEILWIFNDLDAWKLLFVDHEFQVAKAKIDSVNFWKFELSKRQEYSDNSDVLFGDFFGDGLTFEEDVFISRL